MNDYNTYWEKCWQDEDSEELYKYLEGYFELNSREIDIFKEHNIVNVCDVACGFGAYSLAFSSNGFNVSSFDISETAVETTISGLKRYGLDASHVRVASILDTGYADDTFDGVVAHAVLDHLTLDDAKRALSELSRITVPNGLILLSFDIPEDEDLAEDHITLDDGTMQYTSKSREGMLFRPYGRDRISELLYGYKIVYQDEKGKRENIVIIET